MKRVQALIAAVIITALVGSAMLAVGLSAVLNPNAVAASNAPASGATVADANSAGAGTVPADAQAQINQLQNQIAQDQAQIQQYQALLQEMQQRGLIRLNGDGSIQLRQRSVFREPGD